MSGFRLLGPIELHVNGTTVDLGHPKQRAVIASLAVDHGRPVSVETLIDRVWDQSPPAQARHVLYGHLSRIRRILADATSGMGGDVSLDRRPGGYQLLADPETIDLCRFRKLIAQARMPEHSDEHRAGLLREAMDLWSGDALSGVWGDWAARLRSTLHQERLDAVVLWAECQLRLGRPTEVVSQLRPLVADNPLVELLIAQLIRALYAAGRAAEALDCYVVARQRLSEELGTEPGQHLQELHRTILHGTPLLSATGSGHEPAATAATQRPGPAQLPPDVFGFTGRDDQLRQLDALLGGLGTGDASPRIATIGGPPGVGKTALALHWAHQVRDRFSDGQLYLNLRGYDPSGSPMKPGEAIRMFLDALGVPSDQVPASLPAQVGLYRTVLARRRVLIVLDNARDADQVRPLLPGSPNCMAVVTSRDQMTGLVAADGAHPLSLGLMDPHEARDLVAKRLAPHRLAAEPQAADDIIAHAKGLPLALSILAARAATNPHLPLSALAADLRQVHRHLDAFSNQDATTDPRAVFSWSYLSLSPQAAQLFRLLGLHTGPDIACAAIAALAGTTVAQVRPLAHELVRAHLITEHVPNRYTLHDLLRAYAAELVHSVETVPQLDEAQRRLLDYYLYRAYTAALLIHPCRDPLNPLPERPAAAEEFAGAEDAWAWFDTEALVLIAAVEHCAAVGLTTYCWQLAWTLATYFDRHARWNDWITVQQLGWQAAHQVNDRCGEAFSLRSLAAAQVRLRRFDAAIETLWQALALFRELGDRIGQAHIHCSLAWALSEQESHRDALAHAKIALALYKSTHYEAGWARALNFVGRCHVALGEYEQSLESCHEALSHLSKLDDRPGQAAAWVSMGLAYHRVARHHHAILAFRRAVQLRRDVADRYGEAVALTQLGDVHFSLDDSHSAREVWERALQLLDKLGNADAARVRTRLDSAGVTA